MTEQLLTSHQCLYSVSRFVQQRSKMKPKRSRQTFGCASLGRRVTQVTKFYTTAPNIFSKITVLLSLAHKNVHQFTRTEKKAPDNGDVHRSLQNCGYIARISLHVTILAP